MSASKAWGYATGRGVKIAIIDSSIDFTHNDLIDNISNLSYDASTGSSPYMQFDAEDIHGTHCAGIISAIRNNKIQVCGVAPDATLMPIRVNMKARDARNQFVKAINWARENSADILLCAWECSRDSLIIKALEKALDEGRNGKGCIIIKSAGNKGSTTGAITFPGNFNREIITVGAITQSGDRLVESSYGDYLFVCAPGSNILSTTPNNQLKYASGTSTAAPQVAGVAALILERDPTLTAKQVREIIARNATDINPDAVRVTKEFNQPWDKEYGYGLVNAFDCVRNTPRK